MYWLFYLSTAQLGAELGSVMPRCVRTGVSNEFNAIYVTGNAVNELMFYGKGAGALPTGGAMVGDIIAIAKTL